MAARTILVIDDDQFARVYLRDALAEMDGHEFRVVEAADGAAGVEAAKREKPDLVLLDLLMPVKSGLEALPEIRRVAPSAPVIVISSMDAPSMIEQAKRDGAVDFIGKPFHPQEIAIKVKKALTS